MDENSVDMGWGWKTVLGLATVVVLGLVCLLGFRGCAVTYVENYELGYRFDNLSGQVTIYDHSGYVVEWPLIVSVHTIDTRPVQVCINSNSTVASVNQRVLNCKLVRFDRNGLDLFLSWHGRADYDLNTIKEILKIYAYDETGEVYPFLEVLKELKPEEVVFDAIQPSAAPATTQPVQ